MLIFVENVIVGKPMDAMINIDATHNFILVEEAKWLWLKHSFKRHA